MIKPGDQVVTVGCPDWMGGPPNVGCPDRVEVDGADGDGIHPTQNKREVY